MTETRTYADRREYMRSYMRDYRKRRRAAEPGWDMSCTTHRRTAEAHRAHAAVARAIRSGKLVRPTKCEACGAENVRIEGAHKDYSRPLDVDWLCVPCHRFSDRQAPKGGTHKP